ncbi:MAG: type II toxin-antitoxin system VapC family toxin [Blautia sp.]|nr:type II toxin-antitoxin system VapC family toxin [Blautia sp.]
MMYMLDTNAVIMTVRHPEWPIYHKVREHLGKDLCISAVTYGELEYGIHKSSQPEKSRIAVSHILFGIRILDFGLSAAAHFGDIFADLERRHMRISDRDTMIAAHARSLGYTVVTNNTREFSRVTGLKVEDWIEG